MDNVNGKRNAYNNNEIKEKDEYKDEEIYKKFVTSVT